MKSSLVPQGGEKIECKDDICCNVHLFSASVLVFVLLILVRLNCKTEGILLARVSFVRKAMQGVVSGPRLLAF